MQYNLDTLNKRYALLTPAERIRQFYKDFAGQNALFTSSFGATAAYMLHMVHEINSDQKVHFIDTGFHFPETIDYKQKIAGRLGLEVVDLKPQPADHEVTKNNATWQNNPDLCCQINKISPLEQIKGQYDVWMSGLMGYQSPYRRSLNIFEEKDGILRFYPVIDVSEQEVESYMEQHELPVNPLKNFGFESIGCKHCTRPGKYREGRWVGAEKTECGLHA